MMETIKHYEYKSKMSNRRRAGSGNRYRQIIGRFLRVCSVLLFCAYALSLARDTCTRVCLLSEKYTCSNKKK